MRAKILLFFRASWIFCTLCIFLCCSSIRFRVSVSLAQASYGFDIKWIISTLFAHTSRLQPLLNVYKVYF